MTVASPTRAVAAHRGAAAARERRRAPADVRVNAEDRHPDARERLIRAYAEHRHPDVRERLVRDYLPLANMIARRFARGDRVPLDDLQQIAALGLLKALDRFDPDNGAAFSSFAAPTIQGEIQRYLRDRTWTVRPPRDVQERALRIERERDQLTSDLRRNPTTGELAQRLGSTLEDVLDTIEAAQARGSDSFDRPVPDHDGGDAATLAEQLGAEDTGFAAAEASATLDGLLATLSDRDARVVHLRFCEDLTQAEIGRRIGCSQMHVSRILRAALAQLTDHAQAAAPPSRRPQRELALD
jgi:RNA polymerase sigma-B factor